MTGRVQKKCKAKCHEHYVEEKAGEGRCVECEPCRAGSGWNFTDIRQILVSLIGCVAGSPRPAEQEIVFRNPNQDCIQCLQLCYSTGLQIPCHEFCTACSPYMEKKKNETHLEFEASADSMKLSARKLPAAHSPIGQPDTPSVESGECLVVSVMVVVTVNECGRLRCQSHIFPDGMAYRDPSKNCLKCYKICQDTKNAMKMSCLRACEDKCPIAQPVADSVFAETWKAEETTSAEEEKPEHGWIEMLRQPLLVVVLGLLCILFPKMFAGEFCLHMSMNCKLDFAGPEHNKTYNYQKHGNRQASFETATEDLASEGKRARDDTSEICEGQKHAHDSSESGKSGYINSQKVCDTDQENIHTCDGSESIDTEKIKIQDVIDNINVNEKADACAACPQSEVTGLASAKSYIRTAIPGTHRNVDVRRNDQHWSDQLLDDERAHTWHDTNETQIPPLSPVIRLSMIEPWTVVSQHKQPPSDPLAVARIYAPSSGTTPRLKSYNIISRIIDISVYDARKFQSAFVSRWWNNRYMRQWLVKCMRLSRELVKLLLDRCGRHDKHNMVERNLKLLNSRKTPGKRRRAAFVLVLIFVCDLIVLKMFTDGGILLHMSVNVTFSKAIENHYLGHSKPEYTDCGCWYREIFNDIGKVETRPQNNKKYHCQKHGNRQVNAHNCSQDVDSLDNNGEAGELGYEGRKSVALAYVDDEAYNKLDMQDMVDKMKLLKSGRKTRGTDPRHWNRRHLQKQRTPLDNVTGCAGLSANTDGELTKNSDSSSNSEHQPLTIQRRRSVDLIRMLIETTPSHKKTSVCPEYELNSSTVSEQQLSSEVRDDDTVSADVGSPSLHTLELGVFKVQQDCVKHDKETDTRDDTLTLITEYDLDEPLSVSADFGSPSLVLHTLDLGVLKMQQDCVKQDKETDTRDDTIIFTPELDEPLLSENIGSSRPLQPDGTESSITCSDTENRILTIHEYDYEKEVCQRYKLGYQMKVVPSRERLLPNVQSKTFQTLKPDHSIVVQEEGNIVDMSLKLKSNSTGGDIDEHELRRLMRQCTWLPLHRLPVPLIQIDVYQNASFTALQEIFKNLVHDPNLGARTTMKYELLRICTFREYPRHNKPFIIRMAGSGFYHASVADEVVCYSCGVRRRGWATKDNPMTLHRSISPTCKFLLENETVNIPVSKVASNNVLERSLANNDTETSVNATQASADTEPTSSRSSSRAENVSMSQPILPVQTESRAEVESAGAKPSNPTNASKSRSEGHLVGASNAAEGATTVSHIPDVSSEMPKHPHYAVKSVRLASYRGWSVNLNQTPEMMADAGYFYAGLRHWTNDDNVWVEHARWSPDCLYLKKMKGNDFIDLVKNAIIDPEQDVREESRTVSRFQDQQGSRHEQINRILLGDAAQSILGMGYETSMVRRAIDIVLNSQGEAGIRAEALMEEVLNIEDRENELNLASLQISSASGQSKDTGYATFQTGQGVKNDATKVTDSQFIRADGGAQGVSNPLPKPVGTTKKDKLEEARKIRAENRLLKEQTLCKVCLDKEVSIVFLPCGHLVTCDVCAPAMRKCPICRALVKGNVKTFLS